ncbi:MAG TPA: DegT/DnrJ/EryC1/StrS family aminotransferase [Candidatus Tumulicola sp.]|jgi:dTDP-4-amino-4,6-dideoxygalactose transaminase
MNVPFVDLKAQYASIKPEIDAAIGDVLESTAFVLGPQVEQFEEAFARFTGSRYCVGLESGTAALKIAFEAIGIGPGDEILVPANTYIASALAASAVGAVPVLVDANDDYLLDPDAIEAAVTPRTKAILPVHLYGRAVPMEPILDVARRHGLRVVEDACQAHGARWQGKRVGSIGDVGCFSFYPGKNLGAYGDGGALVTDDPAVAQRARLLRDFGQERKYEHTIKGDNCRLDSIQAAVLDVKLRRLDEWNGRRRAHARRYDELLAAAGFPVAETAAGDDHVYHLYVTQVSDRANVRDRLAQCGVQTGIHYPIPIHLQPAYSDLGYARGRFPKTESAATRILSLPMFAELSDEQIEHVAASLTQAARADRPAARAS